MITFLCGCNSRLEIPVKLEDVFDSMDVDSELDVRSEVEKYLKTFDGVEHDEEGFVVCAFHGYRRSGWRSVPYNLKAPCPGMGAWTPLQYEHFLIYGSIPERHKIEIDVDRVPDRRFNDDPVPIGLKILSMRNGR